MLMILDVDLSFQESWQILHVPIFKMLMHGPLQVLMEDATEQSSKWAFLLSFKQDSWFMKVSLASFIRYS